MYTATSVLPIAECLLQNILHYKQRYDIHVKQRVVKLATVLMFVCQRIFYLILFLIFYIFLYCNEKEKVKVDA
jgi:hypothetical protein